MRKALGMLSAVKRAFFVAACVRQEPTEQLRVTFGLASDNAVYQHRNRILAELRRILSKDMGISPATI